MGVARASYPAPADAIRTGNAAYSDEAGRVFRFQAGQHSNMKPATVPI